MECAVAKWVYSFFRIFAINVYYWMHVVKWMVRARPNDHHRHVFMMSKQNALDIMSQSLKQIRYEINFVDTSHFNFSLLHNTVSSAFFLVNAMMIMLLFFFFVFASFILVEYHGDETNDGHLFRWAAVLFTAICSFIRVNHLNWNEQKQTEKRNGGQACSLLHNTTRKRIGGWFVPKPFYVWFELRYACKQRFELDVRRWTQQINRLNGKSKKGKQALRRHCDDNNNNKSNANKKQQTQQQWSQRNHLTLSFVSND